VGAILSDLPAAVLVSRITLAIAIIEEEIMKTWVVFLTTVAMLLCAVQVQLAVARTWYILPNGMGGQNFR